MRVLDSSGQDRNENLVASRKEKRLSMTKERCNLQDYCISGTGLEEDNASVHGTGFMKEESCGKRWEGANGPGEVSVKEYDGTFVGLLRNTVGERCGKWVNDDVGLEFVKSGYVLEGYVPELKDRDEKGGLIK